MLIESRYVVSSLFISTVILFLGWIAALVGKTEAFEKHVIWWRKQRLLKRAAVVAVLIGVIAYAGTKPDPSGGDDTGGSSTNDVTQVEGDAGSTNDVGWIEGDLDGTNDVDQIGGDTNSVGGVMLNAPRPMFVGAPSLGGRGSVVGTPVAGAEGFSLVSVGHDETFDFNPPETAVVATNWLLHGASTQPLRLSFDDWVFPYGGEGYSNFTVFAYGELMPGEVNTNHFLVPFGASLGIAPVANWHLLSTNSNQTIEHHSSDFASQSDLRSVDISEQSNNSPVSLFWSGFSPSNTLLLTWQNALLDRAAANPVSFQAELKPSGGFVFRYDLSRLASDCLLTNVVIGAKNGEAESFPLQEDGIVDFRTSGEDTASPLSITNLSSLAFQTLDERSCDENREDFDEKIGDEDPYAYPEGSTNTVLEHVFYSGSTNGPFASPQSTDGNAVLMVSVSGSGSGELLVGSKFVPLVGHPAPVRGPRLFAPPPSPPLTLAVAVPRGSTQKVYMRGDSSLSVSFSSEDFAFGALPDLSGRHFTGWINFPFVNATVPCIHDYNAKKKFVSLPVGSGADALTCMWQGTDEIAASNIPPRSAELTGHFNGHATTPVSYTLSHPDYLFGTNTYTQTARFCPQPPEDDDNGYYGGGGEDDEAFFCSCCFWGRCWEGCDCGCSCTGDEDEPDAPPPPEDYAACTNYPHLSGVLKIRDPLAYTAPIHLTVPDEHRNCCPCPDHATNWVAVVYQSNRLKVIDEDGQDFRSSARSLDVRIAGVAPSESVGDAAVSFAANGDVCFEGEYTTLGVGIGKWDVDLRLLNEINPGFGLPIPVCTNDEQMVDLYLVTNVRLPFGNIHVGFEDAVGDFALWAWDSAQGEYVMIADTETGPLDISFAGWRRLVGGSTEQYSSQTPVYVTSTSTGTVTLVYRYWGVADGELVEDEARQAISSVAPVVLADISRDGAIDDTDAGCQIAGTPFRFWTNDDTCKGDYIGADPNVAPNASDAVVNGKCDLVNLFPVKVDLSRFHAAWGGLATLKLRAWTDNLRYCVLGDLDSSDVSRLQTAAIHNVDDGLVESTALTPLDSEGVDLDDVCEEGQHALMLAFEAAGPVNEWNGPEVVVSLGDSEVYSYRLPLRIASVDSMFRFGNLREAVSDPAFSPVIPYVASYGEKDLDVFFTHGFNVTMDEARTWGRILFKRLWHVGFNARFHMLTWEGNYNWLGDWANGLHYQHDVWYALRTAAALKRYVETAQPVAAKRILMTQSLGNMVACEALREGLHVSKYFMFDAAVATECFDSSLQNADATVRAKYVPEEWQTYPALSWAANWYKWFEDDATDARGSMGWPGRFVAALGNTGDAYNYYSSGDVVFHETASTPWLFEGMDESSDNYCWQKQETLKGSILPAGTIYGGWGFHKWPNGFNPDNYAEIYAHYSSAEASAMVADGSVTNNPVFNRGFAPMFDRNAPEDDCLLVLAKYVPAVSSPIGGTEVVTDGISENHNLNSSAYRNGWGRPATNDLAPWLHSDMKDMANFYVYKLYEELIQKGKMK